MPTLRCIALRCMAVPLLLALIPPPSMALHPQRAANHYTIENWGPRNGFPEETIFAITQTVDGYLWIATPAGLVRFDGQDFTFFDRERVPGLQPLRVTDLWLRPTALSGCAMSRACCGDMLAGSFTGSMDPANGASEPCAGWGVTPPIASGSSPTPPLTSGATGDSSGTS